MNNERTVTVGPLLISHAHVWEKWSGKPQTIKPSYNLNGIFKKTNTKILAQVNASIEAAKELAKTKKWGNKIPDKLDTFLKDGDVEFPNDPAYKDCYFISLKSDDAPFVVDRNRQPILDKTEFYSGCTGFVNYTTWGYNEPKNGVTAFLNGVMKTKDGEALGGTKISSDEAFADVDLSDIEVDDDL